MLGGEHSITPPAVKAHKDAYGDIAILSLDAHLDFRSDYLGESNSHACSLRRNSEIAGVKKVAAVRICSVSREEWANLRHTREFHSSFRRA